MLRFATAHCGGALRSAWPRAATPSRRRRPAAFGEGRKKFSAALAVSRLSGENRRRFLPEAIVASYEQEIAASRESVATRAMETIFAEFMKLNAGEREFVADMLQHVRAEATESPPGHLDRFASAYLREFLQTQLASAYLTARGGSHP